MQSRVRDLKNKMGAQNLSHPMSLALDGMLLNMLTALVDTQIEYTAEIKEKEATIKGLIRGGNV